MSKSKGNVVDPLGIVDDYGADALRFTLTAMSGQGRNINLSQQRIEGYRNFTTKLWNAARFCQINGCARDPGFDPGAATLTLNRWIRGETVKASHDVTRALNASAFDEAAGVLYRFVWNVFCDWWLELAKPVLNGEDAARQGGDPRRGHLGDRSGAEAAASDRPVHHRGALGRAGRGGHVDDRGLARLPLAWVDPDAQAELGWLIELVTEVRSIRSEMNAPGGARLPLTISGADPVTRDRLSRYGELIRTLARLESIAETDAPGGGAAPFVVGGATFALEVAGVVGRPR